MTQNNPRDERAVPRRFAALEMRVKKLETAPRAGHTSISNGRLLVRDGANGELIASLAGTAGTDQDGNPYPAGLGATSGSVDGAVLQPASVDATKVSFTVRDLSGITTTVGPTEPTTPVEGDLWIDTSSGNVLTRFDGTDWTALPVGTDAIQAGAVTASQIAANTVTAAQVAAGIVDGEVITGATIRTISNDGGFFAYAGTPTLGNLIVSIASAAGTDDFGNDYPQGLDVNQGAVSGSLITVEPGPGNGVFVYGTAPQVTTFSSGSGTWVAPAGVTSVKVEAWGAGGGGADYLSPQGGGGGGGGEYAAQATLAVTPGNSYAYVVGSGGAAGTGGGNGGDGGDSTFDGTLVVANGGTGGFGLGDGVGGIRGSGSTNTTHFDGGEGADAGEGFSAPTTLGGAGGGSGGYTSAGNPPFDVATPDVPAAAVTGGSAGGKGGTTSKAAVAGGSPGGGGGGAGSQGTAAAGAKGRITITYTPARTLLASLAGEAGTDPYGNAYPKGIYGQVTTDQTTYLSDKASDPTYGSAGSFVSYTNAQWPYVEIVCPPSEAIVVSLRTEGGNSVSAASSLRFGALVTDQTAGGGTVISSSTVRGSCHVNFGLANATTPTSVMSFERHVLGALGEFAGMAGHTLRITPQYRLSSGANTNVTVGTCRMTVEPLINTTDFV